MNVRISDWLIAIPKTAEQLRLACRDWAEEALQTTEPQRDSVWTESLAVRRSVFVQGVKERLGLKAHRREVIEEGEVHVLREPACSYTSTLGHEKPVLS